MDRSTKKESGRKTVVRVEGTGSWSVVGHLGESRRRELKTSCRGTTFDHGKNTCSEGVTGNNNWGEKDRCRQSYATTTKKKEEGDGKGEE